VLIVGVQVLPSAAQDPPPPIAAKPLTPRSVFFDDVDLKIKLKPDAKATTVVNQGDPSRTVVVRYTVQPGARFPWHSHAGPASTTSSRTTPGRGRWSSSRRSLARLAADRC